MKINQLIAEHLATAFEGENWSEVTVKDSLKGLHFQQATRATAASPNTIAALLYHMTFYNKAILERLRGKEPQLNESNGFDVPVIASEDDWVRLKNNAFDTAHHLAEAIRRFPEERLEEENPAGKGSMYKKLQGVIEHNYYHLGQIVILKNLIHHDLDR